MKISPLLLALALLISISPPLPAREAGVASGIKTQVTVIPAVASGAVTPIQPLSLGDILPTIGGSVTVEPVANVAMAGGSGPPPHLLAAHPASEAILDIVGSGSKTFSLSVFPVTLTGVRTHSTMTFDSFNIRVTSQAGAPIVDNGNHSFTFPGPANSPSHALIHIGGTLHLSAGGIQPADTYNGALNLTVQFQ